MSAPVACPFCRELFQDVGATACPHCEIALVPIERLPPSHEDLERQAAEWEQNGRLDEARSWLDGRAGRGALLALALAGLSLFAWAPWVDVTTPHAMTRTGYSLARGPLAWLWGGAVAWFTCLVMVATRRTLRQMLGVRAIAALLCGMTLVETLMLLGIPPDRPRLVPIAYEWSWGLYASLALSAVGVVVALRFGRDSLLGTPRADDPFAVASGGGAPQGHTLH